MFKQFAAAVILLASIGLCVSPSEKESLILSNIYKNQYEVMEYAQVVLHMVTRFITQRTNTLIIMENCLNECDQHRLYHKTVLRYFLDNLNYTLTTQLFFGQPDDRLWDYNMFLVARWWDFHSLRYRIPNTKHDRQFYFFIVLTWFFPHREAYRSHLMRIFEMCQSFNVKNVVVMIKPHDQAYFSFYTYQTYAQDNCGEKVTIEEINRFENGKLQQNFLFPDHMNNFHGCTLTVCGNIISPLLTFSGDPKNTTLLRDMQRLGGIEGEILKLVARTMNSKLEYRFTPDLFTDSGARTLRGCFEDLDKKRAHMAIGGLSPLIPNAEKFSVSYAHHSSPYVFVVRSGVFFGALKQLLYPLETNAWLALLAHILIAIVVIEIIQRFGNRTWQNFIFGPRNKYPTRSLFVTLIGNPLPTTSVPTRNFARFLLMTWLLWTFELRNFYQGKMFDSLRQAKRRPTPVTINELIEQDYLMLSLFYNDFYPENKTLLVPIGARRLDLLSQSSLRLTTTAMLDYLADYNMHNWKSTTLTYVDETIYLYQCVVFFPKHSVLLPSFNRKFKMLSNAGITSYLAQQKVHSYFRNTKAHITSGDVGRITHENLAGLYYIYAAMSGLAIMTFILEMATKRLTLIKRLLDYFN